MFSEWEDPYNIDNYYDDVGSLFPKVVAYETQTMSKPQQNLETQTVSNIGQNIITPQTTRPIDSAPNKVGIVQTPLGSNKLNFESNQIPDQLTHPVGKQPLYNILRSGPPTKENFDSLQDFYYYKTSKYDDIISNINIILWLIIITMILNILKKIKSLCCKNLFKHMFDKHQISLINHSK